MLKSRKKIFIILIIICIIILVILGITLQKQKMKNNHIPHTPVGPRTDRYLELSGFSVFFDKYTGELTSSEISSKLQSIITQYLPETYDIVKTYDEMQLKNYYNQNMYNIKLYFGTNDYSEFSNLITAIKEKNIDIKNWNRLDVLKETFIDESDKEEYSYVEYYVTYENNEKIKFSLYLSKFENKLPICIIDVVK